MRTSLNNFCRFLSKKDRYKNIKKIGSHFKGEKCPLPTFAKFGGYRAIWCHWGHKWNWMSRLSLLNFCMPCLMILTILWRWSHSQALLGVYTLAFPRMHVFSSTSCGRPMKKSAEHARDGNRDLQERVIASCLRRVPSSSFFLNLEVSFSGCANIGCIMNNSLEWYTTT
jgi:hypothetical protein